MSFASRSALVSFALSALAAAGPTSTARAQAPAPAAQPAPEDGVRRGMNVSVAVGGGNLSCDGPGCDHVTGAGSVDVAVGTMLRPRLRLLGEVWGMGHTEDSITVTQTLVTGGIQYWILDRLWVTGGIGAAHASFAYNGDLIRYEDRTDDVFGFALGVGYEILSRRTFALDAALRYGTGFYTDSDVNAHNEALTIGATWY